MEARIARTLVAALAICSMAASYRTPNFVVSAPSAEFAQQVGDAAEAYRRDLANDWLGETLPQWSQPCPIQVTVGPSLGAGGATSFVFDHGEVFQWRMNIQGSQERILDSVLPHEVTHTIFATHFRRPLPRWADEGACTTVEHTSERSKQDRMLIEFLQTRRGIPFSRMFAMKEYPHDVMPLYSQGYSLAMFLIGHGGKQRFIKYIEDGLNSQQWVETTRRHYHFENLAQLQDTWLAWVANGSPELPGQVTPDQVAQSDVQLASATEPAAGDVLMRSQSPDDATVDNVPTGPNADGASQPRQDVGTIPTRFAKATNSPAQAVNKASPFSFAVARSNNVPGGDPNRVLLEWSINKSQVTGTQAAAPDVASAPPGPSSSGGFSAPSSQRQTPPARATTWMAGQRPTMLR